MISRMPGSDPAFVYFTVHFEDGADTSCLIAEDSEGLLLETKVAFGALAESGSGAGVRCGAKEKEHQQQPRAAILS